MSQSKLTGATYWLWAGRLQVEKKPAGLSALQTDSGCSCASQVWCLRRRRVCEGLLVLSRDAAWLSPDCLCASASLFPSTTSLTTAETPQTRPKRSHNGEKGRARSSRMILEETLGGVYGRGRPQRSGRNNKCPLTWGRAAAPHHP